MHAHTYTHTHTYTHRNYIHACTYTYIHEHTHTCAYTYIQAHTHNIHTYIHTYMHAHTQHTYVYTLHVCTHIRLNSLHASRQVGPHFPVHAKHKILNATVHAKHKILNANTHTHTCTCMHGHAHTCTYTYIHMLIHIAEAFDSAPAKVIQSCPFVHAFSSDVVNALSTCPYTYVHTYVHTYIYIHAHVHTHRRSFRFCSCQIDIILSVCPCAQQRCCECTIVGRIYHFLSDRSSNVGKRRPRIFQQDISQRVLVVVSDKRKKSSFCRRFKVARNELENDIGAGKRSVCVCVCVGIITHLSSNSSSSSSNPHYSVNA